jgi:hypothetical protein
MYGIFGTILCIGAAILTMDLYEAYSALNKLSSYGLFGKMVTNNPEVQNKMMMHTLGAAGLWIVGLGFIGYHFAPDAAGTKSQDTSPVAPTATESAPAVVAEHSHSDTRECPHCAEIIKAAAKLCRYCHSAVEPVAKAPVVQSPVAAAKTPGPNDFTWSLGGVTVSKPVSTSSNSNNAFSHFARRH